MACKPTSTQLMAFATRRCSYAAARTSEAAGTLVDEESRAERGAVVSVKVVLSASTRAAAPASDSAMSSVQAREGRLTQERERGRLSGVVAPATRDATWRVSTRGGNGGGQAGGTGGESTSR